jgi:single-strand DNA-binding protein
MEMIGRVTGDALVRNTANGKQLVAFQLALNDSFKAAGGERKQVTTFISCAWWRSTNVATVLKKGALVSLSGRLSASAYLNSQGEPKAQIECNVSNFQVHAKGLQHQKQPEAAGITKAKATRSRRNHRTT